MMKMTQIIPSVPSCSTTAKVVQVNGQDVEVGVFPFLN